MGGRSVPSIPFLRYLNHLETPFEGIRKHPGQGLFYGLNSGIEAVR
jgi:hypothetical protein